MNVEPGGGASRSTDPAAGSSSATDVSLREFFAQGWTLAAYIAHNEAMRAMEDRLRTAEEKFQEERDRRYAEKDIEREKALAIKEKADETARILVAENQAYRDEKGNELRSQIERERGLYATKDEIKPISDYVVSQQGPARALTAGTVLAFIGGLAVLVGLYLSLNPQ